MLPRICGLEFGLAIKGFKTRRMFREEDLSDPLEMGRDERRLQEGVCYQAVNKNGRTDLEAGKEK